MIKFFTGRQSMIGDIITHLPILTCLSKEFPNSYKIFSLAKKCSQIIPLLINHPEIDKILVSEPNEGLGQKDIDVIRTCNYFIDPNPVHKQYDWYNYRHMIEENFHMLDMENRIDTLSNEERTPTLVKWFDTERRKKSIAIWPFAEYNRAPKRNPSVKWWLDVLLPLSKDYKILHFGVPQEYGFNNDISNYENLTHLTFFDQIKVALGTDFMMGTDSGSSLVMAGYGMPQICVLTNHNVNHEQNYLALSPRNKNAINLFGKNGCDNISHESVFDAVARIKN